MRAGYSPREIEETLEHLTSRGYLNDSAYARDVARSKAERKHWGPARIERKLRELHLSQTDIEAALHELFSEGEEDSARKALERYLRQTRRVAGERGRARAYRHLCARGFSPSVAHRLVTARSFDDTGDSEPE